MASNNGGLSPAQIKRAQMEDEKSLAYGLAIFFPVVLIFLLAMFRGNLFATMVSKYAFIGAYVIVTFLAIEMISEGVLVQSMGGFEQLNEENFVQRNAIMKFTIGVILAFVAASMLCSLFDKCRGRMRGYSNTADSMMSGIFGDSMSFGRKRGRKKKC